MLVVIADAGIDGSVGAGMADRGAGMAGCIAGAGMAGRIVAGAGMTDRIAGMAGRVGAGMWRIVVPEWQVEFAPERRRVVVP